MAVRKNGSDVITPSSTKTKRGSSKRKTASRKSVSKSASKAPPERANETTPEPEEAPKRGSRGKYKKKPKPKPTAPPSKVSYRGRKPIYETVTPEQLRNICDLVQTGRATLEAAVQVNICATHTCITNANASGEQAVIKAADGGELDEREQKAYEWFAAISKALAHGEILLTRQAAGDARIIIATDENGKPVYASENPKHATNALGILRLTRKHWRPVLETKVQMQGTLTALTDEELLAKEAALRAAIGQDE
jgi:hypothetical protein